ncbi:MAG: MFS transporter [Candidatus Eremiobacteraeota bacterium]|nr:MFS transporter [Candidatus Eremiobacteraeota bacterium]
MAEFTTNIPQRLDRLPWSRWHSVIVIGLGITWILDGLEVTMVGSIGSRLKDRAALGLSDEAVGYAATSYLIGAVLGSLVFGYLTDRFGRKKLFLITLGWYVVATLLTAFSWNETSFLVFRFLTGFGIGGEYSAINSTIDELIPSAHRGWVDLAINGTYWFGAILGSGASILLLNPHLVNQAYGWRLAFGIGAVLAFSIIFVREGIPESPRWQITHDKVDAANENMAEIEAEIRKEHGGDALPEAEGTMSLDPKRRHGFGDIVRTMVKTYPERTVVVFALMISQAFLYNAFVFTNSLVLTNFFKVAASDVGWYTLPFSIGNLAGAILLGRLFDTIGRKPMIAFTYAFSAVGILVTGVLFVMGALNAVTITVCWCVTFFVASAGASAAYLTVSEIFPLEIRAMAIALVYSVGTLVGGAVAPSFYGRLIATKQPSMVLVGYAVAAALMLAAAAIELRYGGEAAGKKLEDVAAPLGATAPATK